MKNRNVFIGIAVVIVVAVVAVFAASPNLFQGKLTLNIGGKGTEKCPSDPELIISSDGDFDEIELENLANSSANIKGKKKCSVLAVIETRYPTTGRNFVITPIENIKVNRNSQGDIKNVSIDKHVDGKYISNDLISGETGQYNFNLDTGIYIQRSNRYGDVIYGSTTTPYFEIYIGEHLELIDLMKNHNFGNDYFFQ